jgi:hypothetical protein
MDATSEIGKIQGLHRSNINIVMKLENLPKIDKNELLKTYIHDSACTGK